VATLFEEIPDSGAARAPVDRVTTAGHVSRNVQAENEEDLR
jgi:hypothetical protein